MAFWHFDIWPFWHFGILTFWRFDILLLLHLGIFTFWHFDSLTLWHFDILEFWLPRGPQRFKMVLLSSEMVPLSSKMARRGSKTRPQTGGSFAGRSRVARGSAGRSRVADFSSRSGKTRVAGRPATKYILLYLSSAWPPTRADPRRGGQKKSVLGVYRGKGGCEFCIHQTEKLSVRHSGNSGCSPSAKTAFRKTVATTNDGEQRKTTTTDDD